MNIIISKFYKLGLLSLDSLQLYFEEVLSEDEKIKSYYLNLGHKEPLIHMIESFIKTGLKIGDVSRFNYLWCEFSNW